MRIEGPASRIFIDTTLPGDKSIAHRSAIVASLGTTRVQLGNYPSGKDCSTTLDVLKNLGVPIVRQGSDVTVDGVGLDGMKQPGLPLDCGNSGTTARLLCGVLAAQKFNSQLVGDASLSKRPMRRIAEPLSRMGGNIQLSAGDTLPIAIEGRNLKAITYELPVASAQVKSCLLLAGLFAEGTTTVIDRFGTRDHTERLLKCKRSGGVISVNRSNVPTLADRTLPGDLSSAAFLIAAGVLVPDSEVVLRDVSLNPTRTAFIELLQKAGADIRIEHAVEADEPHGSLVIRYRSGPLKSVEVDKHLIPHLIDEIPLLGIVGTRMTDGLVLRGAGELRLKESDRITLIVHNLRAMGATVVEYDDGFAVAPCSLHGGVVATDGDHRIAMAFAVAGLAAAGETVLDSLESAAISFPEFADMIGLTHTEYA